MNEIRKSYVPNINENENLKITQLYENNIKKMNYFPLNHFSYSVKNLNKISPNKINNNYNIHNNIYFSPQRPFTSILNKNYKKLNYYYSYNKNFLNNNNNISTLFKSSSNEYKIRPMDSFFDKYSKKVKDIQKQLNLNKIYCKQTPKIEKNKKSIKYRHLSISDFKDINQNQNRNNKNNLESLNNNYISNTTNNINSISPKNNNKILNIHNIIKKNINKKIFSKI